MRRPICVKCQIEMSPIKNGIVVEIMAGAESYQKIMADKFGCPECKVEVVVGFAKMPLRNAWKAGYSDMQADLKAWGSMADQQAYDDARIASIQGGGK